MRNKAAFLVLLVLLTSASFPCAGRAEDLSAADTIRKFYDVLLTTMQSGPGLGPKGRYARLKPVIGEIFDLPYMTRLVVGPSWARVSDAQRKQVTGAFEHYITATYANRFDRYAGQKLEVAGERSHATDMIVDSRIIKANGNAVLIKYLLRPNSGRWRVVDVYLNGTISELATRRSEFSSILRERGIDGLTTVLNTKAETLVENSAR